jgi:protein phosphatase PTC6
MDGRSGEHPKVSSIVHRQGDHSSWSSIGDGEWKPSGITAEPEVRSQIIDGKCRLCFICLQPVLCVRPKADTPGDAYAYLVLASDGLTSLITDQEIVDLARSAPDPSRAARIIVNFGEDLDAQDNCTCVVVPLKGWGKVGGLDITKDRREYRKRQAGSMSTRMQRM